MDIDASGSRHVNVKELDVQNVCLLHTTVHFTSAAAAPFTSQKKVHVIWMKETGSQQPFNS